MSDKSKGAISKTSNTKQPQQPQPEAIKRKQQKQNNSNKYEDSWNCSKCTLINSTKNKVCILCGASYLKTKDDPAIAESNVSIFDSVRDEENEEMPRKGNVLDRVVQFTAMQMFVDERPASVMTSTPRNSMGFEEENERPFSAMNSRTELFAPTPIVHRVQNSNANYEQKRLSVLEKEETTDILARWKKEHEDREKARKEFFKPMAPKDSVIETQAALLHEAKRNLDRQTAANENRKKVSSEPKQRATNHVTPSATNKLTSPQNVDTKTPIANKKEAVRPQNVKNSTTSATPLSQSKKQIPSKDQTSRIINGLSNEKQASKTAQQVAKQSDVKSDINGHQTVEKVTTEKQKPVSHSQPIRTRFDPSKTPSSFIPGKSLSPSSEEQSDEPKMSEQLAEMTKTALRLKRLEYFGKSPPSTNVKKDTIPKKSEVIKAIEMEEQYGHYDIPVCPPRKVSDSFFEKKMIPHPFKSPQKRHSTISCTDYEPVLIEVKKDEHDSKSAKVIKTTSVQNGTRRKSNEPMASSRKSSNNDRQHDITTPRPASRRQSTVTPSRKASSSSASSSSRKSSINDREVLRSRPNLQSRRSSNELVKQTGQSDRKPRKTSDQQDSKSKRNNIPSRDIVTPVTPSVQRMEIKPLKLSGPALDQSRKPQRPARNNKFRKSQSLECPTPQPSQKVAQKPSTGKVDEIDDLVTRQVHDYEPPVVRRTKPRSVMLRSGAIPKAKHTSDRTNSIIASSDIVDDILYLAGPLKKEVKRSQKQKEQRDSSTSSSNTEMNQLLAFPLIPLDKFDPKNTLSKRKQKKAIANTTSSFTKNDNATSMSSKANISKAPGKNLSNNKKRFAEKKKQQQQNTQISTLSSQMGNPNEIHAEVTIQTPPTSKFFFFDLFE